MTRDLLDLAAELVAIPSESFDETRLADWIEARLGALAHLEVTRHGDNVVARTDIGAEQRVLIAGHLDTVPANNNLPGVIEGDRLTGLGACDMKGSLAAMVALAEDVVAPRLDVTYVFYEAEEVAAIHNGLLTLFSQRPDLLACDVAVLGEPTSAVIEAGCQGTLRVRVTLNGERAHTARPWMGRNAIHRAAGLLERLAEYEGRRPVLAGCEYREALQAVAIEGGVAGNVVPDSCVVTINHRFAPDRTAEEAVAHVRDVVGDCDGFDITDLSPAAPPSVDHPILAALIDRNSLDVNAKLGWTDVARFAEHGVPAINFGAGDPTIAHTQGEFVERHEIDTIHGALRELLTVGLTADDDEP